MAVIAANVTNETVDLINQILRTPEIMRFTEENDLNLFDNTILIRLALINFIKHIPKNDEVIPFKNALRLKEALKQNPQAEFWFEENLIHGAPGFGYGERIKNFFEKLV